MSELQLSVETSSASEATVDLSGVDGRYQRLEEFRVPANFRGRSKFVVQLWWAVQATLFAMSPQILYEWRALLLRMFGAQVGRGVIVRSSVTTPYPWKLTIGDHCHIGDDVCLYSYGEITIGASSVVSQRSYLCAGSHDHTSPTFDLIAKPITIGRESWIATDVFVAPGVTIGPGAVVGARSSVFSDIPGGTIAMGTPAQVVGLRTMKQERSKIATEKH